MKFLKDQKVKKVQAAIQADQVRVSAPSKDDLQEAMRLLRGHDFGIELQFGNYRSESAVGGHGPPLIALPARRVYPSLFFSSHSTAVGLPGPRLLMALARRSVRREIGSCTS